MINLETKHYFHHYPIVTALQHHFTIHLVTLDTKSKRKKPNTFVYSINEIINSFKGLNIQAALAHLSQMVKLLNDLLMQNQYQVNNILATIG
jgi:hypothetical protein